MKRCSFESRAFFPLAESLLPTSQLRHEFLRAEVDSKKCESLRTVVFQILRPVEPNNNLASLANLHKSLEPGPLFNTTKSWGECKRVTSWTGVVSVLTSVTCWTGEVSVLISVHNNSTACDCVGSLRIKSRAALPNTV